MILTRYEKNVLEFIAAYGEKGVEYSRVADFGYAARKALRVLTDDGLISVVDVGDDVRAILLTERGRAMASANGR